jgi:diguanylate cyclase (GGDEF)-like protein
VRLFQRTRELSISDEVTPLYNFRFFHTMLTRELKLVDRYQSVLSLIFLDLDNFKPINDQYGHLRGSRTLREVGFLLRAAVRETDYPARYGGDEFVILPQTGRPGRALADKLRGLIEEHVFLQEEGIDARIGCSLGVPPASEADSGSPIRMADERMYADKGSRSDDPTAASVQLHLLRLGLPGPRMPAIRTSWARSGRSSCRSPSRTRRLHRKARLRFEAEALRSRA